MPSHSRRTSLFVNLLVSIVNGAIALVLLLIAPLGLASVVTLTLLITISTFVSGIAAVVLVRWLENKENPSRSTPSDQGQSWLLKAGSWRLPNR